MTSEIALTSLLFFSFSKRPSIGNGIVVFREKCYNTVKNNMKRCPLKSIIRENVDKLHQLYTTSTSVTKIFTGEDTSYFVDPQPFSRSYVCAVRTLSAATATKNGSITTVIIVKTYLIYIPKGYSTV